MSDHTESEEHEEEEGAGEQREAHPQQGEATPRPRGGRLLAGTALLLALLAAVLAAWPWYAQWVPWLEVPSPAPAVERAQEGPEPAEIEASLEALRGETASRFEELETRFGTRFDRAQGRIDAALDDLEQLAGQMRETATGQELDALEERLADEIAALRRAAAAPGRAAWRLDEAEHLLRLANHRLLLERDAERAQRMLSAADRLLADLDDPGLHRVREEIATEQARLEDTVAVEREETFLELEGLKWRLGTLPLRLPEFLASRQDAPEETIEELAGRQDEPFWERLLERLSRLFEFRRHDEARLRPLLTPDQAETLQMNLRLMLERAQTAMLRDEAGVYRASLESARRWLEEYLDPADPEVAAVVTELEVLADIELAPELPDISGSLAELRAYREREQPVAPEPEPERALEPEGEPEPDAEPEPEPEAGPDSEPEPAADPEMEQAPEDEPAADAEAQ